MTALLTTPAALGSGGAHLAPGGASGSPDLKTILDNHKTVIAEAVAAGAQAIAGLPQKRRVTIGHADLTAAANGATQAVDIGAALPAGSRILGTEIKVTTPFSGGGLASCAIDIGTAGDPDAFVDGADVFSAAVDGESATRPLGICPNKSFPAGVQLQALVIPDAGHNLVDITAGAVSVEVMFVVLP